MAVRRLAPRRCRTADADPQPALRSGAAEPAGSVTARDARHDRVGAGRERRGDPQPHDEARTAIGRELDDDLPLVPLNDLVTDVEAQPEARPVVLGVGLVEALEDRVWFVLVASITPLGDICADA